MKLHEEIALHYPQYHDLQHYPKDRVALIRRTKDEWGIFGNFYQAPIEVNGVRFDCTERLFHLMKFKPEAREGIREEYFGARAGMNIKQHMKPMYREHPEWFRCDWGSMVVDAMRFCLQTKYEQCEPFRRELARSAELGLFIAEKAHGKEYDSYSAILQGDEYVGPNLLGRLLMELRDSGRLEYHLPEDALCFVEHLKDNKK